MGMTLNREVCTLKKLDACPKLVIYACKTWRVEISEYKHIPLTSCIHRYLNFQFYATIRLCCQILGSIHSDLLASAVGRTKSSATHPPRHVQARRLNALVAHAPKQNASFAVELHQGTEHPLQLYQLLHLSTLAAQLPWQQWHHQPS